MRLNGDGDWPTIAELSAKAPNGGAVEASGSIVIDPDAEFPADISLRFDDALIIDGDIVSAEVRG